MSDRVSVTIGIPFLNARRYLEDAVRSVFAQTHGDWELLLIDDGSTDGSIAVVRLTWISTVTGSDGVARTDDEQGLDIFEKQADGSWKIIRYIAYPENPE